jgi:hypothetical protein
LGVIRRHPDAIASKSCKTDRSLFWQSSTRPLKPPMPVTSNCTARSTLRDTVKIMTTRSDGISTADFGELGKPPLRIVPVHPGVALNLKRRIPAPTAPELNLTRIWDHRKVEGQGGGCAPSNWLARRRIRVGLDHFGSALNCSAAARTVSRWYQRDSETNKPLSTIIK